MSGAMEFEGRTEQEAVQKACVALKLGERELDYTVVDEGSGGLFGLGSRPVRIRARVSAAPENQVKEVVGEESDEESRGGVVGPAPEKAARALEVAQGLAERMGVRAKISVRDEHEQIVIVIEEAEGTTDVGDVLGKSRPPAIPSFQFLLNKVVNRFPEGRKHILVEVPSVPRRAAKSNEGRIREGRNNQPRVPSEPDPDLDPTLVALGLRLAEKAKSLKKVLTVHPMLPGDRRAIHQTIMSVEGVSTMSEGEGLYRRMHVVPNELRAGGGNPERRRRRRRRRRGGGRDGEGRGEGGGAREQAPDAPV